MRSWRSSRPSCSRRLLTLAAATSLTLMLSARCSVVVSTCSVMWNSQGLLAVVRADLSLGQWSHICGYSPALSGPSTGSPPPGARHALGEVRERLGGLGERPLLP